MEPVNIGTYLFHLLKLLLIIRLVSLTGSSPFALMFGRELNELKDYSDDPEYLPSHLDDWKQHQEKILSLYLSCYL